MIEIYRKKPVIIEAIQWKGSNQKEVQSFINENGYIKGDYIDIGTSEGVMVASIGDYIIKEPYDKARGFYPCKEEVFLQTYEKVEQEVDNVR